MNYKLTFSRGKLEAKIVAHFKFDVYSYLDEETTNSDCICSFSEIINGRKYDFELNYYPEAKEIYKDIVCMYDNCDVKLTLTSYNHNPKAETLKQKLDAIIQYQHDKNNDIEDQLNIKDNYSEHM